MNSGKIYTTFLLTLTLFASSCTVFESKAPEDKIRKAFKDNFGLELARIPVVYTNDWGRYTSTHYRNNFLYRIYYDNNGNINASTFIPSFPEGLKNVLCMVVLYDELLQVENLEEMLEGEQERINDEHREFATQKGYDKPIVQFNSTNLFVDLTAIDFSSAASLPDSIRILTAYYELNMEDFDHLVFLDMNVKIPAGGWADIKNGIVRVGWIHGDAEINQENMAGIANAVYHHEIGHLWGWEHEWSDADTLSNFITDPSLFGWEDYDLDGKPDILTEF